MDGERSKPGSKKEPEEELKSGQGLPDRKPEKRRYIGKKKSRKSTDVKGMKKAIFPCISLLLLILVGLAMLPSGAAAGHMEVKSVTRKACFFLRGTGGSNAEH